MSLDEDDSFLYFHAVSCNIRMEKWAQCFHLGSFSPPSILPYLSALLICAPTPHQVSLGSRRCEVSHLAVRGGCLSSDTFCATCTDFSPSLPAPAWSEASKLKRAHFLRLLNFRNEIFQAFVIFRWGLCSVGVIVNAAVRSGYSTHQPSFRSTAPRSVLPAFPSGEMPFSH